MGRVVPKGERPGARSDLHRRDTRLVSARISGQGAPAGIPGSKDTDHRLPSTDDRRREKQPRQPRTGDLDHLPHAQGRRQGTQRPGDRSFAAFARGRGTDRTKAAFATALARIGSYRAGCGHRQLIYRPEYYNFDTWEDGTPTAGQAEFIIAKHRNGDLRSIRLAFVGPLAQFSDLDQSAPSSAPEAGGYPSGSPGAPYAVQDSYDSKINNAFGGGFDPRALPSDAFESRINRPPADQDDDKPPF